jgi:hypothetical protein
MSTESSLQNTGSSSTPIPTIVNGTPSTPATATVAVSEAYTSTMARPVVNASSLASNPFGGFGHSPGYNVQSIPMASSPFSYGMPNFTSQFSTAIPAVGPNASLGLGGTTPPYTPFPFGGSHIPQMNPNLGSVPFLNPGSNPSTAGWNNPAGGQVPPYIPISSVSIPTNTFGMMNPLQSSGFPPGGGQSYTLGNPQPGSNPVGGNFQNPQLGSNPAGGNFHNPYQNIPAGMMPNPSYTNHPRGGPYNSGQGFGPYQNPGWNAVPNAQSFAGGWGQMSQPRLPFLATLNLPDLSKLMNDPVSHDPTWPPVPTKLPSDIPKFEGKNGEDPGDHVTTFHLWCSSNSLNHDSIRLRLFQCTLIGVVSQWYIELPRGTYGSFHQLVLAFLNHFQLPIRYDVGLELLSTLRQGTDTHISDHIQEWRRWKWLIKTPIPPTFLLEWFLKSLHPPISKDVATSGSSMRKKLSLEPNNSI